MDIAKVKEDIKQIKGKEPTKMELTCYLLGYSDGLLKRQELGEEPPTGAKPSGLNIKCPHCGKETPKDAASCIYCHQKVR